LAASVVLYVTTPAEPPSLISERTDSAHFRRHAELLDSWQALNDSNPHRAP
jgi:hypothetical protein